MKTNKLSIFVKVSNKERQLVDSMRSGKSRRIFKYIQREDFSDYLFELSITYPTGVKNETNFQNKKDTLKCLRVFLER